MNRTVYFNKLAAQKIKALSKKEGISINAAINRLINSNSGVDTPILQKKVDEELDELTTNGTKKVSKPQNNSSKRVNLSDFGI